MWRALAPRLARRFTVVCADLRGYGQSGVRGSPLDAGHLFPEEAPRESAEALEEFVSDP